MAKPILYSFWRSSCSWRVRIALHLKDIDYELRTVDIFKQKMQLTEEYRKINPIQKVPVLVVDGTPLIESMNILYYLEENYPDKMSLIPKNPIQRIKAREISEMIISGIQPLQNVGLRQYPTLVEDKPFLKFAQHWIKKGLTAVETLAKSSSSDYCVGNDITIADCCLVPQLFNAKKYDVDIKDYPTLYKIKEKLEINPAFFLTHPDTQPDAPPRT